MLGANNAQISTGFHLIFPNHRGIAAPMEILANSGLTPTWCNECTNVNCILTESWGSAEVKNVFFSSVQTTHKLLRATKLIFPIHSGIAPPMEILVIWRRKPTRCNVCTNANCILTESWCWGSAEVKNVVLLSVQTAQKLLRAIKLIFPIHRGIATPMEILVNWGLKPTRCDDCTTVNCILAESWGSAEVKNVVLLSVQTTQKFLRVISRCKQRTNFYRAPNPSVKGSLKNCSSYTQLHARGF